MHHLLFFLEAVEPATSGPSTAFRFPFLFANRKDSRTILRSSVLYGIVCRQIAVSSGTKDSRTRPFSVGGTIS